MATTWEWDDDRNRRSGIFKSGTRWSGKFFNRDYVIALMCIIEDIPTFQRLRLGAPNKHLTFVPCSALVRICQCEAMTH